MPDEANEVVEPLGGPTIDDAKRKLLEALAILDQLQAPAEIGARLQDVIDRLDSPPIE